MKRSPRYIVLLADKNAELILAAGVRPEVRRTYLAEQGSRRDLGLVRLSRSEALLRQAKEKGWPVSPNRY